MTWFDRLLHLPEYLSELQDHHHVAAFLSTPGTHPSSAHFSQSSLPWVEVGTDLSCPRPAAWNVSNCLEPPLIGLPRP